MIAVSTSSLKDNKDIFRVLDSFAGLEIDAIELGAMHSAIKDLGPFHKFRQEHDFRYTIHAVFPPMAKPIMINLGSNDPDILKRSFAAAEQSIDFAQKIDAVQYTLHAARVPEGGTQEQTHKRFIQNLARVYDYANDHGVRMGCENSSGEKGYLFNVPEEIEWAIRDYPKLKLLIDIGHLSVTSVRFGYSAQDFVKRFQDRAIQLHIHENDGSFDQHKPLHDGKFLDMFDKGVLRRAVCVLEGQDNWSLNDIKGSISALRSRI